MKFRRPHICIAIRGSRGVTGITESTEMTVRWLKKIGIERIHSTESIGDVERKDEVTVEEKDEFFRILKENHIEVLHHETVKEALENVLEEIEEDDLLLLAGCQGMDKGGRYLLEMIEERGISSPGYDVMAALKDRIV